MSLICNIVFTGKSYRLIFPKFTEPFPKIAKTPANEVLANRIFIAHAVRKEDLAGRWRTAVKVFDEDDDPIKFGTAFGELTASILKGARAHIGKV